MEITIADVISKSSEKIKRLMVQSFFLYIFSKPAEWKESFPVKASV